MRFVVLLLSGLLSFNGLAQSRHALLVGAADYETHTRWTDLSSANDMGLMKHALLRQGFPAENIRIVIDPTKEDLVQALQRWPERLHQGDVAYFHFSGHGQSVVDLNGDEPSGFDQSLVPVNAGMIPGVPFPSPTGDELYFGQHHLVDDEFATLLADVRRALGPEGQLACALDACHSGSATRAPAPQRGSGLPMMMGPDSPPALPERMAMEEPWMDPRSEAGLAPMVAFFGCGSAELNSECVMAAEGQLMKRRYGSLSYALASAFERIHGTSASWGEVFRLVRSQMGRIVPNQTPGMEGDPGSGMFNGLGRADDLRLALTQVEGTTLNIQGGHLMGVRKGSVLRLVDLEQEGAEVLAEVTAVGPTSCTAEAQESGFAPGALDAVSISTVTPGFEHVTMTYSCPSCSKAERKALKSAFKPEPWLVHEPDTALAQATLHAVEGGWTWQNRAGDPILTWTRSLETNLSPDRWKSSMLRAAQVQQLLALEMASEALDAAIILEAGTVEDLQGRSAHTQDSRQDDLVIQMMKEPREESTQLVCFSLKNTTKDKLHYTLLLIDEGEVTHLNEQSAFERKLNGFEQGGTNCWQSRGFAGDTRNAVMKVILSNQPIAFEAPFVESTGGSRSVAHPALSMFAPPDSAVEEDGSRSVGSLEVEVMTIPIRVMNN